MSALTGPRVMHAANMLLEAKRWIEATHPAAWKRCGGRDHIWLVPNDEGAASLSNGIRISGSRPGSGSGFMPGVIVLHRSC